jgi:serine phosphatase RsbU (regulator of sigma subunit)
MPTTEPIRIDWRYVPAADLAGDALGFQWIDDDHCALYVIDVCGHGLDASLLSVTILNVLKSMSLPATDFRRPNQVLAELNRKFPMERHGDRGFTAWYGVYVRSAGELRWSAGGHPPALLFSSQNANDPVKRLDSLGPMIGMLSDSEFDCQSCAVANGDRLLIYSDGVFEFETPEGRFGTLEEFIAFARDRGRWIRRKWSPRHQMAVRRRRVARIRFRSASAVRGWRSDRSLDDGQQRGRAQWAGNSGRVDHVPGLGQ